MHECKFCDRTFVGARALGKHQLEHDKLVPRVVPNISELWAIIQQLAKNDSKIKKNMKILVKKNKLYEKEIEDLMKRLKKSENNISKLRKKGKFNIPAINKLINATPETIIPASCISLKNM